MSQTKAELIDGKGDVVFDTDTLAVDATNNRVGIGEAAPGTQVEVNGTEPYITIKNSTQEDTDGGRESKIIFEGEQSGGEISTLAQIEVSHDGAVDDEKGKIVISTNDGTDGAAPTTALTIGADQTVAVANNLTVNGNQYPTDGSLSNRNLIINGAMQVAQRGTSFSMGASDLYTLDRWEARIGSGFNADSTITREQDGPPGFASSLKITPDSTQAPTGDQNSVIHYAIEARDLQPLAYGTASAKSSVMSFWVKSNKTGIYCFQLQCSDTAKIYVREYEIFSSGVWEHKEIVIPGDTAASIDNNVAIGFACYWHLASGVNDHVDESTEWTTEAAGFFRTTSNQVNFFDSTANEFYLTGVQYEIGTKSTPFEHRSYADELHRCRRYYFDLFYDATTASVGIPIRADANNNRELMFMNSPAIRIDDADLTVTLTSGTLNENSIANPYFTRILVSGSNDTTLIFVTAVKVDAEL